MEFYSLLKELGPEEDTRPRDDRAFESADELLDAPRGRDLQHVLGLDRLDHIANRSALRHAARTRNDDLVEHSRALRRQALGSTRGNG